MIAICHKRQNIGNALKILGVTMQFATNWDHFIARLTHTYLLTTSLGFFFSNLSTCPKQLFSYLHVDSILETIVPLPNLAI